VSLQNELIIDHPKLQTVGQKVRYSLITAMFWAFWFYLLAPLISLIAWVLGFKLFYEQMILLEGWAGFTQKIITYLIVLVIFASIFFSWAIYNQFRFQKERRRGRYWKPGVISFASEFDIPEGDVLECQNAQRLEIYFNEDGTISEVKNTIPLE
jgi:biofilm PGA synthesis protein PgaD